VVVATENGSVLRDPRLDALLANHQQYASRASLQTPADFLRNASFEEARSSGRTAK
jgi:sigma-E factor negative regulatory protein RseA